MCRSQKVKLWVAHLWIKCEQINYVLTTQIWLKERILFVGTFLYSYERSYEWNVILLLMLMLIVTKVIYTLCSVAALMFVHLYLSSLWVATINTSHNFVWSGHQLLYIIYCEPLFIFLVFCCFSCVLGAHLCK